MLPPAGINSVADISRFHARTQPKATALIYGERRTDYGTLDRKSKHVVDRGLWPYEFMFTLGLIIGGGTSQIQKNIISERGLGMPKSA